MNVFLKRFFASVLFCSLLFPLNEINAEKSKFASGIKLGLGISVGVALGITAGVTLLGFLRGQQLVHHGDCSHGEVEQDKEDQNKKTTFDDVVGSEEVLVEVREFVDFVKNPENYSRVGAERPSGLILHGPPGCGKTLIARAIAGESDYHFIQTSGAEFVQIFVGTGAANVRGLFARARMLAKEKPVILLIEEIDGIGSRTQSVGGGDTEYNNTIIEFLKQMNDCENILVIGTTNRLELLDPALLRAGRFDRKIYVGLPTRDDREKIMKYYLQKRVIDESLKADDIVENFISRSIGFSGADIENFINEASIFAGRVGEEAVKKEHFEEAMDKITLGLKSNIKQSPEQLKVTAHHEAGHALVAQLFNLPIQKVTILPRGNSFGVAWLGKVHESLSNYTKSELKHHAMFLLGGFAAETLFFGEPTPGSSSDLEKVGEGVGRMIRDFGMGKKFEGIVIRAVYSDASFREMDCEVTETITELLGETKRLIEKHKDKVEEIAKELLEKEVISADRLTEIVGDRKGCEIR
jgi:ATP-dependent metalloprotease FtsH